MYMKYVAHHVIIFFICIYLLLIPKLIYAAAPITGTFVVPDLFYSSESAYREFFQELHDTGIDTVILMLTNQLTKNCQSGAYTEQISSRIQAGSPPYIPTFIKLAKEFNMSVYFSLGDFAVDSPCFIFHSGDASNEATDKGRLIAMSLRTIDTLKQTVSNSGVSWSDPIIRGFYIYAETDTEYLSVSTYPQVTFLKEMSAKIKQKEPSKKILYSPFQKESTDYAKSKQAFTNIYSLTSIDIVAPQDSMGSQLTTSYARSSDHFRALKDAVSSYSGKEAWANIESFTPGSDAFVNYIPTTIDKLKQQITAASPYISRMITWMYTHTMLSNPRSDNMAAVNQYAVQYTQTNATRRKALRAAYMSSYGILQMTPFPTNVCTILYYYHKTSKSCINTSNTYNNAQIDCNGTQALCSTNLQTYLPGLTTGICYASLTVCKSANSILTPTPTQIRTPTPTTRTITPTPTTTNIIPTGRTSETPTPTRISSGTPVPTMITSQRATSTSSLKTYGDFTGDGKVNTDDIVLIQTRFGKPFTIYDYAMAIQYYGK